MTKQNRPSKPHLKASIVAMEQIREIGSLLVQLENLEKESQAADPTSPPASEMTSRSTAQRSN
jgi:hypothetical protein